MTEQYLHSIPVSQSSQSFPSMDLQLSTKDSIRPEHKLEFKRQADMQPVYQIHYGEINHTPIWVMGFPSIRAIS
jgi:hypothetical protein